MPTLENVQSNEQYNFDTSKKYALSSQYVYNIKNNLTDMIQNLRKNFEIIQLCYKHWTFCSNK